MRAVGDIKGREQALRFVNFLAAQGIEAELRTETDDAYRVWVHDEDELASAEDHLKAFALAPADRRFDSTTRIRGAADEQLPESPLAKRDRERSAASTARSMAQRDPGFSLGTLTILLILASVGITLLVKSPQGAALAGNLFFSEYDAGDFREIAAGQVWRLVTPIFMHGSFIHIFFNMLWLLQLGGTIERHEGTRVLGLLVLAAALVCNTSQYLVSGPAFMGMSGVVYALLGYVWMMSRHQAGSPYGIHPQTVALMLVWLVLCLVGFIPGVANTQHVAGLALGALIGFLRSGRMRSLWRRYRFKRSM